MNIDVFRNQYTLVKDSRAAVFDYCRRIGDAAYVTPVEEKSIRDLHVHVANVYLHWLVLVVRQESRPYFDPSTTDTVAVARELYTSIDEIVESFLHEFGDRWTNSMIQKIPRRDISLTTTPLTIFTHVITHEFHHKGQILSKGRRLGHVPPDTDIIRF